jgi:hypothetical protein
VWIVLIWILFGGAAAAIANGKQRSGWGWFFLGVLFGPFALIVIVFLPALRVRQSSRLVWSILAFARFVPSGLRLPQLFANIAVKIIEPVLAPAAVLNLIPEPGPITKSLARHNT